MEESENIYTKAIKDHLISQKESVLDISLNLVTLPNAIHSLRDKITDIESYIRKVLGFMAFLYYRKRKLYDKLEKEYQEYLEGMKKDDKT